MNLLTFFQKNQGMNNEIANNTMSMSSSSTLSSEYFDTYQTEDELKYFENMKILEFLNNKCNDIEKLVKLFQTDDTDIFNIERFQNKKIVVKGFVQSGKTNFIITAAAFFKLIGNKDIVIITRNFTDDEIQLQSRINQFVIDMKQSTIDSQGKYFINIGNASSLRRLNNQLKGKEYILFVDEVDFIDNTGTLTNLQLEKIKNKSYCFFGISATVMDPLLKVELNDTKLIVLSKPENYRGIESFIVKIIPNKNTILTRTRADPIIDDPNLYNYLNEFSLRTPYMVPLYNEYHPVDTLIRVSTAISPNRRLLCYLAERFPSIVSMFFSGGGTIELYIPNITNSIELCDGKKSILQKLTTEEGELPGVYHRFSCTSPSQIKQWLYENGGVSTYPRIITLAGQLASRCISYGASNFEICKRENKLWWHLTEMYLCASESMDQPELMQTAGRLCVATPNGDNIPLTLYVQEKVKNDLIKSYWLQEELIDRAQEHHRLNGNPLWCLIQYVKINKKKIPSKFRRLTKSKNLDYDLMETKDCDEGYPLKKYNFDKEDEIKEDVEDERKETEIELEPGLKYISKRHSNLSKSELETYDLIEEYFNENYNSGWIKREKIGKWLMKKLEITNSQAHSKLEHLIDKNSMKVDKNCIIFKKTGSRWILRKI